jgi:hypothetical protein
MLVDGIDDLVERSYLTSRDLIDVRRWHESCNSRCRKLETPDGALFWGHHAQC